MSVPAVSDDRARWLAACLLLIFQEFEPDDLPVGISVQALSGGQLVTYGLDVNGGEITRFITDPADLANARAALGGVLDKVMIDATPPDGPP